jgi:plasmid stability protein
MAQLTIRNIDPEVVRKLKALAKMHHVSLNEKCRNILTLSVPVNRRSVRPPRNLVLKVLNPFEAKPKVRTIDFGNLR